MYYEAATLDGGSKWQVFRHVTLPLLTPAMSTAVIQNVIGGLKLNDVIISLTKGGPTLKTHSLSTYISYMYFDSEKQATPRRLVYSCSYSSLSSRHS